ncbi:MAG: ankyrin repeat domain-containing protein [Elusimicrobia bacterium]|nr:ankyrin repeat domain-containing protein [Elusimicrobiota bacterium]
MQKLSVISIVSFFLMLSLFQPCYAADTPLHNAVNKYQVGTVRTLIRNGANVNVVDGKGNTPLICAAQMGSIDMVQMLISAGAKVNTKNNKGYSAMDCAAEYTTEANLEIIKMLERAGGRLSANAEPVLNGLKNAIYSDNVEFAKKLINKGANVNAKYDKKTPFLFLAASKNNPEMVSILLDAGAKVNIGTENIGSPLCAAIVGDIDNQDYSSIEFSDNSVEIAKLLIDYGADVNLGTKGENLTPLYWACVERSCNPEMLVLLLQSGADINRASIDNKSLFELTKLSESNKININKYSQIMRILKYPKMFTNKKKV